MSEAALREAGTLGITNAYPLPGILNDQLIRFGSACMRNVAGL